VRNRKQQLAQKRTQAAQKKKAVEMGKPGTVADISKSRKHLYLLFSNESLRAISFSKEELKVLEFKAWKGTISLAENLCLAVLRGVGGSSGEGGVWFGPDPPGPS
jgi:hypothetical protein